MAGEVDLEAMLRRHTAKQFREWWLYKQMEPTESLRADYRSAQIVQMLVNLQRGKKQKPYTLEDFRLRFGEQEEKPKQTWQAKLAIAYAIAAAHNSTLTKQ